LAEIEIGIFKSGRQAYGFDDIAIVPSRRTRDPEDVDISWEIDAYRFDLPVLGAAMDGDNSLFAREDYVEEAWRIVDPVLKKGTPVFPYATNTWGPAEVAHVNPPGGWDVPARGPDNLSADS